MTAIGTSAALLVFLMLSIASYGIETRKALVIGNDDYPGNQLRNAVNDATSVAEAFKSLGYTTTLDTNVSRAAMENAIDSFAQRLNAGDTAILYYAGHGLQVDGENYLVPTDFKVSTPAEVPYQGYSLSSVLTKFTEHGAKTEVVILDACRNNPFLGTRSVQEGWANMSTSAGTLLAFGTSPGSTASDDPTSSHGLFTQELLKYLTASPLSAEQMFQKVREDVVRASDGAQVPWTASSLIGSFHFNPTLDTSYAALPPMSNLASASTIDPLGRSIARGNHDVSNHFTASSLGREQRTQATAMDGQEDADVYFPLVTRAVMLAQKGDYNNSVRALEAVLELDPQSSLALRVLGLVLNLMGNRDQSINSLNRAISIDPQDAKAYYYKCLVLGPSDGAAAVEDCEASLGIDPKDDEVHLGLANAFLDLGQLSRAHLEADRAIELDPNSALGYSILGKISAREGDVVGAKQDYQRAMTLEGQP